MPSSCVIITTSNSIIIIPIIKRFDYYQLKYCHSFICVRTVSLTRVKNRVKNKIIHGNEALKDIDKPARQCWEYF